MKSFFIYLLSALLSVYGGRAVAQTVIDLSTGVNNSVLLPVGSADDTWTVRFPGAPANTFQSALVSNGAPYNFLDPSIRWIGPTLNGSGQNIGSPVGNYFYKMNFSLSQCVLASSRCNAPAAINFQYIGGDDVIDQVIVNGNVHTVSYAYNAFAINNPFTINASIPVLGSELVAGVNEIMVRVNNGGGPTGLEIKGDITIQANGLDYQLKNKDGVESSSFCLGEDVFLDGSSLNLDNYFIELGIVNGASVQWISAQGPIGWATGSPNWVNIRTLFENDYEAPVVFQPNTTYRIKFASNTNCGLITTMKDFEYVCCESSTDPGFELVTSNGMLQAQAVGSGVHQWKVYTTPGISNGPYTPLGTYTTPKLSLEAPSSCYYVVHKLSNGCGQSCSSRRFCTINCEDVGCILTAPTNPVTSSKGPILSWSPVTGAATYIVEITINDPNCCGLFPSNTTVTHQVTVTTNSYIPTPQSLGMISFSDVKCFSWRVYAVCPNGSKSLASTSQCATIGIQRMNNTEVGIDNAQLANGSVLISPNPAQDHVSIDVVMVSETSFNVTVFDQTGRIVKTFADQKTSGNKASIDWNTETLSKGIYLVKIVTSESQVVTKKLVIE